MNKVILITGGSSGIGKATALKLIAEGHMVYAAARRLSCMNDIESKGGRILSMDLTAHESIASGLKKIITEQGRIDGLVNNAGYGLFGSVEKTEIIDARKQFDVNLFGLAKLTQLVIPHMRKLKSGTIVNVSSMGGKIYTPLCAWYHATKFALEGFSDSLRLEVKNFGIKVAVIEPGAIDTGFGEAAFSQLKKSHDCGPYAPLARMLSSANKKTFKKASSPAVVADAIATALASGHPKTRYVVGKYARPMLLLRSLLSDKSFDRFIETALIKP